MTVERIAQLKHACKQMRRDCLVMADAAGELGFHFGGTFSLIEIAVSLYIEVMRTGKETINDKNRDRVILSKGHGVPAIYAVLKQIGILSDEDIRTFKNDVTDLYGHPCMNDRLGIEFSTGSLGQGLSQGVGVAAALRHYGNISSKVYVILGDGECDEGSVWEAAMSATKFGLTNLVVVIDRNHVQYDGNTEEIMPLGSLENKWKSFGWNVVTIDGHDLLQCCDAFRIQSDLPLAIIANTIKGKGVSFMENNPFWHHGILTKTQREEAWKEVSDDTI
ncbi:MAG: tktA1 [Firmicutes bacterium]|nr:tktA1 [Bacillota bacterium]